MSLLILVVALFLFIAPAYGQDADTAQAGKLEAGINTRSYKDSLLFLQHWLAQTPNNQIIKRGGILAGMAFIHMQMGNFDSAIWYLNGAAGLARQTNDTALLCKVYLNFGNYHEYRGELTEAKQYLNKNINIAKHGFPMQLADAYYCLGLVFYDEEKYDSAIYHFGLAMAIFDSVGSPRDVNTALLNIGNGYMKKQQFDTAALYFRDIIYSRSAYMERSLFSLALMDLGVVHLNIGFLDSALFYFHRSKNLDKALNSHRLYKDYFNLKATHEELERYDSAYYYLIKENEIFNRVFSAEREKTIANLETQFEARQKNDRQQVQQAQLAAGSSALEKQKARAKFLWAGVIFFLLMAAMVFIFYRHRIQLRQRVAMDQEQLHRQRMAEVAKSKELATINAAVEGQEIERQKLAEEIHDHIGSMLATVKLRFGSLQHELGRTCQAQLQEYEAADALLDRACQEVRKISHNVSTGTLSEFGLVPALRELVATIEDSRQMRVKLLLNGNPERLSRQMELNAYRIVQELVGNIIKHAKASIITISINFHNHVLNLIIEDNGQGLVLEEALKKEGLGLSSIRDRVETAGGSFLIDSTPGKGTLLILDIPYATAKGRG